MLCEGSAEPGVLEGRSSRVRAALLIVAASLCSLGIASPTGTSSSDRAAANRPATVLAIRADRHGSRLVRLDRRTVVPVGGKRVALGSGAGAGAWALSPDGSRLAIGVEDALGLRIVDTKRMRAVAEVKTRNGQIEVAAWLTPRRIVGLEQTGLFVVDPVARRLIRSEPLEDYAVAVGRTADELVLLLAPRDELGWARLALVNAEGVVRSVALDRILAGSRFPAEPGATVGENWSPGLALDAVGARAFVVGGGSPIAEVDLRSLTVRYREPARRASLLGRLRSWLEPDAHAKGPIVGSRRTARWLGGGFLAFTGEDGRLAGSERVDATVAGVTLVDTSSWEARTLVARANTIAFAAGTLVASLSDPFDPRAGIGLRGYSREGRQRFHLFEGQQVGLMGMLDDRAFVDAIGGTHVVRLATGRAARWNRAPEYLLVGNMRRY
jgi:hypothetical protein